MSINSRIISGAGEQIAASVFRNNSLFVQPHFAPPPIMGSQPMIVFRQYFTNNGLPDGSNDMRVDGSINNQSFFITSYQDVPDNLDTRHAIRDRYITTLSFEIADASASLNQFGNINALTNGCRLLYEREGFGEVEIHDALKSNWDFVRLCLGEPAFGATTNSFLASNVVSTSEAFIPVLDLARIIPPFGIQLAAGSTQKLSLIVRDDTTSIDSFNIIAYGFDRLIDDTEDPINR